MNKPSQTPPDSLGYFSKNLKYILKKQNMKNKDLAEKINLSPSAISNYLAGLSRPRTDQLEALASELKVSIDTLLHIDLENEPETFQKSRLREGPGNYKATLLFTRPTLAFGKIYVHDNYEDEILIPPYMVHSDYKKNNYYAIRVLPEDVLPGTALSEGDIAIFKLTNDFKTDDVVAVLVQDKEKIELRRLEFTEEQIQFISKDNKECFLLNDKNTGYELLGLVVGAVSYKKI